MIHVKENPNWNPLCQQEPQRIRTSPKFEAMEVDEKDEKMKTKPVPACYIRGPPLSQPQVAQVSIMTLSYQMYPGKAD